MQTKTDKNREQENTSLPKATHEPTQGGMAQLADNRPATVYQRKLQDTMNASATSKAAPLQPKANNTGLPDNLKTGIENLSGYSMDDVKVHYNSSKPAQLQAHAYAQGTDIHLAPSQEKHLPHEAWHVVQQKQGRVKPTKQLKSKVNINDDAGLEKEADVMGEKALSAGSTYSPLIQSNNLQACPQLKVIQRISVDQSITWFDKHVPETGKINLTPVEIKEFISLQKDIEHDGEEVVTMGPEFEFAKVDPGTMGKLPIHVELLESTENINGLPFVFETDAGNVIEAAFPPFTIGKKGENFKDIAYRAMRITSQIEKYLKGLAEGLASGGGKLSDLINGIEEGLGIKLQTKADYTTEYTNMPLLRFTKGIGSYTNEFVTSDEVTNAQINITMGLDALGGALQGAIATKRGQDHMERKMATTEWLMEKLDGGDSGHINILAYYISQIPMMALQNLMIQARQAKPDRDAFKESSPINADLLSKLSSIKDFMGFWVKAGLNDLIKSDDALNTLLKRINKDELQGFLLSNENFTELRDEHVNALVNFDRGSGGVKADSYKLMVEAIIEGMFEMSQKIGESNPIRSVGILPEADKGQNVDSSTKYLGGADTEGNAAPFMARPDTHVAIPNDQFLVEVRGLNKGVLGNENMRIFYMPGFRLAGEQEEWDFVDHDQRSKDQVQRQGGYKSFETIERDEKRGIKLGYSYRNGIEIRFNRKDLLDRNYGTSAVRRWDTEDVRIVKDKYEHTEYPNVQYGKEWNYTVRIKRNQVDRFIMSMKGYIQSAKGNRKYNAGSNETDGQYKVLCTGSNLRIEVLRKNEKDWKVRLDKKGIDSSYADGIVQKHGFVTTTLSFPDTDASIVLGKFMDAPAFLSFIKERLAPPQN
ncbi:DUF4157 domain-containing protein [Fulvivirga ulvae]|uniref:eCIS core domain-containing protein n=1 Tax=Fulvivirga ulvae TaxID=2904245 RepID=UPI001F24099C|nr:DUF4157 domain-containing protein [Fulvivirga ulvae]UII31361.1 DUF4157 domain-containing protein [Fulvivirga ulvae]